MIDFIRLLDDYGIPKNTNIDGWVNVECPICHHSGTRGFKGGFNIAGGYFNCWNCGGHDGAYALSQLLDVSYYEAESILNNYSDTAIIKGGRKVAKAKSIELPGGPLLPMHRKYIKRRGFDPDYLVKKYSIQGEGYTGEWKFRIIIPIIYDGRIVSFQGRDITGKAGLRYITLAVEKSIINPKSILYNLDNCKGNRLVLVEGPFDVWRLGDGTACSLGTSMEAKQCKLIRDRFDEAIIIFDPEKGAQQKAKKKAMEIASFGTKVSIVDMEWEHDPGSLTQKEITLLRRRLGI